MADDGPGAAPHQAPYRVPFSAKARRLLNSVDDRQMSDGARMFRKESCSSGAVPCADSGREARVQTRAAFRANAAAS